MITWESLDPEAQRHWLALAEAKHGMPVTWIDVEPARRGGLLEIVNTELCPDRWEDETPDRQRHLLAGFDKIDEQLTRQEHEALKIIIDDLGVDCAPEDPDWRALFLALLRKYGPAHARPRGDAGQRMAQSALTEMWLRFARGAAVIAMVFCALAYASHGPGNSAQALQITHQHDE